MSNKAIFEKEKLSLWLKDGIPQTFPSLKSNESCDICIVGAGITGITTAYILSKLDFNVILIESNFPINLTSGNTTAKFTFQHGIIYSKIINNYGLEEALLYYNAQVQGLKFVEDLVNEYNIPCDFKKTYSIIYAEDEDQLKEVEEEYEAYKKLNIPCELIHELPYGINGIAGLKIYDQFELNPVKYLSFLLDKMKNNVKIYQDTNAVDIKETADINTIVTEEKYEISANKIVIATGYPFPDNIGMFYTRLAPYRSYLVAFPIATISEDDAMLISNSTSPYSMRFSDTDGVKYLLVGSKSHKVGQEDSAIDHYNDVIDFGKRYFDISDIKYRWSAQDYESLDKIPYIGQITSKHDNIFVATGYRKWGMSNGSFAAILLSTLLQGKQSEFDELFKPSRGVIHDNLGEFMKVNLTVAKELIKGKILPDKIKLEDIQNDEGGIIKYNGKRAGAYRDKDGKLFIVDNTCTHLGCELEYNNAERSFDCPCHGSRFTYEGKVIEGPATLDLKRIYD